jgi:hypothetical protein
MYCAARVVGVGVVLSIFIFCSCCFRLCTGTGTNASSAEKESAAECQELRKILLKRAQFDSAHAQEDEDRAAAAAEAALRILERRCTDSDPSGCGYSLSLFSLLSAVDMCEFEYLLPFSQLGDYLMSRFKDGVASAVARARTAYERGCNRDKTTCCESLGGKTKNR